MGPSAGQTRALVVEQPHERAVRDPEQRLRSPGDAFRARREYREDGDSPQERDGYARSLRRMGTADRQKMGGRASMSGCMRCGGHT